jgi:hypothetical protein
MAIRFLFTPDDAQAIALAVIKYYRRQGATIRTEVAAWPNAPYRTTVVALKQGLNVLIEAQSAIHFGGSLRDLAVWMAAEHTHGELLVAARWDTATEVGVLLEMSKHGLGLLVVEDDGSVSVSRPARNPALVVHPDPTLKYGAFKTEVEAAVRKFNESDRKDGLRDMCELVERETEHLAILAHRKAGLKPDENAIRAKDWSDQINMLASPNAYDTGHAPVFDSLLKDDFHSFRGARNLIDHKARNRREDARRQRQFAERMVQGPRLIAELAAIQRRLERRV